MRVSGRAGADGAGALPGDRSRWLGCRCVHRRLPAGRGHGATRQLTVEPAIITAFDHQTLSVGDGWAAMLRTPEASRLLELGFSRPGFCTACHRRVTWAHYPGLVNLAILSAL